ncbi:MAG TPA: ribonuclease HII, partial [Flavisolibacter sp.]|nr:ribonuclease HII [Flavisolibacter sp.]
PKGCRIFGSMLQAFFQEELVEAGCDEAGRGCLAGPVFAGAVILPKDFYHPLLNDSKQLTEEQRYELRPFIEQHATAHAVAQLCNRQIDKLNILKASFKSMHLAVKALLFPPQLLLIDGNRFTPYKRIPHKCIVGGDGKYMSIAAASVLAKTYRDDYMKELHQQFPQYNWAKNKGYATKEHQEALEKFGPSRYHRKSFRLDYRQPLLFTETASHPVETPGSLPETV